MANGTPFTAVYNRFLEKITDDMYMELTPEDTARDMQNLLIDAIPGFEFPRKCLDDYTIKTIIIDESEVETGDFILAVMWDELSSSGEVLSPGEGGGLKPDSSLQTPNVLVERSKFNVELSSEEINILALLMKQGWVQRQVSSIENTRMKYSGSIWPIYKETYI